MEEAGTLSKDLINMIRSHHERFDGNGYPDGLVKDQIPLGARIIAVADAYDAMRSERPYGMAKTPEEILSEFEDASGTQFDPMVVKALFSIADQIENVIYAAGRNNHDPLVYSRYSLIRGMTG